VNPLLSPPTVRYALICLRTGTLLESLDDEVPPARLSSLASRAPDLLGDDGMQWPALFARLGSPLDGESFRELVLVSAGHVYVLERLTHRPDVALAAVGLAGEGLGLVLAGVHGKLAELDRDC
jgi:hypothetical protein